MNYVLDCSFTSALFLPDESSKQITSFFSRNNDKKNLIVPQLWWLELSNVLYVSIKRKRLSYADAIKVYNLFTEFDIETDHLMNEKVANSILEIANKNDISAYDASYIELSIRKNANLATLDKKLANTAKQCGILVLEIKH